MADVHPSAIVESGAKIADRVKIGPFCIIGREVELGEGCELISHVVIQNKVKIGKNNRFFPYACLGMEAQDLHFDNFAGHIEVGDNNVFREYFNTHLPKIKDGVTKIGSNGYFMANSHIAHDCIVGDNVILVNYAGLAGHVEIGNNALISGVSMVHQFCRVGEYAIVGGVTKVTRDVPPYCMANGNPATIPGLNIVGLKRSGMSAAERSIIKKAFQIFFLQNRSVSGAIEGLKELAKTIPDSETAQKSRLTSFIEFVAGGKRGIAAHSSNVRSGAGDDLSVE